MIETWFRTADVPAAERFDYWHALASSLCGAARIDNPGPGDFHAEGRALSLGAMGVVTDTKSAFSIVRTPAHVRRHDEERCFLTLLEEGVVRYEQDERQTEVTPGNLIIYPSSAPSVTAAVNHGRSSILHFPRTLLPPVATGLIATTLSARGGLGALVAGSLRELVALPGDRAEEAARLAGITLDLLAALCHRELGTERPATTTPAALLGQVRAFAQRHLADPGLDPAMIAAAHHISVRYLHRLFQQEGQTVAGWIRDQRLERCRRDLGNPLLRERTVRAVAHRWGFTDAAHFTRVFRAAFGLPPGEYRKLAQLPRQRPRSVLA
ncbi:helix-turn-helix domain-containing protein [Crossiella sp. CA-258035]|uniref:helix-turn-helix domain-containing protein n=1 Tax=Crossiella sp. CA-258035 TaxID=2981138 RepID=UPI0024BC1FA9|nr:helix-turn-helix domain-containing protein [Crossiella sp. CA-258035]WHT16821.1 helix-turn-helix domain-containing protein [Crossiella sp. CA-258035]